MEWLELSTKETLDEVSDFGAGVGMNTAGSWGGCQGTPDLRLVVTHFHRREEGAGLLIKRLGCGGS